MKKLFSHNVFFIALLLAPLAVFGEKLNTKYHNRAGQSAHETRYERNCLATVDLNIAYGRAKKGYNSAKEKVDALRIYGLNRIAAASLDALGNPSSNNLNAAFQALAISPAAGSSVINDVGVYYDGKFTMVEANLNYTQNFCSGFFVDINVPIKRLKVDGITRTDGTTDAARATATVEIGNVLAELTDANLMSVYDLSVGDASKTGLGDIMVTGGWTSNNDDIESLDFLDTTIKAGVSIPTAKKRDQNKAFELALGHENHIGIAASFDLGIGFYEWMTLGAHVGGLFFFDKTMEMRMQTNIAHQGYLKLKKGNAKHDMGNIWDAGGHLKADHIFKGFSAMVGYNYVHKGDDNLTPENLTIFPSAAVNADAMLKGWRQHAITVTLEYDMAEEGRRWNPHFSVFYSRPVKGKYIFLTNVGGGSAGLNIAMDF